jgi:hypothetical protein
MPMPMGLGMPMLGGFVQQTSEQQAEAKKLKEAEEKASDKLNLSEVGLFAAHLLRSTFGTHGLPCDCSC